MKNENGGAAFPVAAGPGQQFTQGMSLRDWFAGQVLQGRSAIPGKVDTKYDAELAYRAADAMLAERNKGRAE